MTYYEYLLLYHFGIIVSSGYKAVSGVQVHFKGGQTIKSLLMAPKDKDPITNKSGVIYRYKCSEHGCEEEYIGESARTFAERFQEHQKAPSHIFDHCNTSGHNININNFTIVGREDQNLTRAIKEALFIRVNDPSLNRNKGNTICLTYGMMSYKNIRIEIKTLTQWLFHLLL